MTNSSSFQRRCLVASCLLATATTLPKVSVVGGFSAVGPGAGGLASRSLRRNRHDSVLARHAFLRSSGNGKDGERAGAGGSAKKKQKIEVVRKDNPFLLKPLNAQEKAFFEPLRVTLDDGVELPPPARRRSGGGSRSSNNPFFNPTSGDDGLVEQLQKDGQTSSLDGGKVLLAAGGAALVAGLLAFGGSSLAGSSADQVNVADLASGAQNFLAHPQEALTGAVEGIRSMGPIGALYFGILYCVAEILAVPATPLTLSAGYLFGVGQGAAVVLLAATVAASVAFVIGKTLLRDKVEEMLLEQPKFAKIDKAIGREGFKLLLLVRLSPIFPFALSNYLYGASSIDFASYFWGTLLGFAPGTLAYVYTGMVGSALTDGSGAQEPWYVYAGGFALLATFLKLISDVAGGIVEAIDEEDEEVVKV